MLNSLELAILDLIEEFEPISIDSLCTNTWANKEDVLNSLNKLEKDSLICKKNDMYLSIWEI